MTEVPPRPRAVVCRSADQAEPLKSELEAAGFDVVLLPLIEVRAPDDGGRSLIEAMATLPMVDWLVLTSPNAVRATARALKQHDPSGTLPPRLFVAAVGAASANAARQLLGRVDFTPTIATAECLADELPLDENTRMGSGTARVLAPLAELAGGDLVRGLEARGARVHAVTAYRTVVPELADEQIQQAADADAVLFTSGSTVERFVDLVGANSVPLRAIAIGPKTAERMEHFDVRVTAIAEEASSVGLVKALVNSLHP